MVPSSSADTRAKGKEGGRKPEFLQAVKPNQNKTKGKKEKKEMAIVYFFIFNFVTVYMGERYVHKSAGAHGVQKRESESLQLEVQVVVSFLTWMLGTKSGASV